MNMHDDNCKYEAEKNELLKIKDDIYQKIDSLKLIEPLVNQIIENDLKQESKIKDIDDKIIDLRVHIDNGWRNQFITDTTKKMVDTWLEMQKTKQINWTQIIVSLLTGGVGIFIIQNLMK